VSPRAPDSAHLRKESEDRFTLAGEITFATVPRLSEFGSELLQGSGERYLSLAGVERTDSAGLALLVDWIARARAEGVSLHYLAMPAKLRSLAEISDVGELLECGANPDQGCAEVAPDDGQGAEPAPAEAPAAT
jgi:phospholipid transport system transporter-binding protein